MDKHGDDCNCNDELGHDQVTITLEDDSEIVCDIIAVFPCKEKEYIALLPQDAGEDGEVFLYEFVQNGEEIELETIESDEDFEAVSEAFDEFLDSEEFDEMFGDDDDEDEDDENEDDIEKE